VEVVGSGPVNVVRMVMAMVPPAGGVVAGVVEQVRD
jgi:hypothetical protein